MTEQDKYAELFASEAREHLETMSQALVALESQPGDRDSLDSVFRSVHTIKGMAAAMGYDATTRLAHAIESTLDPIREGGRAVDADLIDLLLESTDLLEVAVESAVAGTEPPDTDRTVDRLERAMAGEAAASGDAPADQPAADDAEAARRPSGSGRVRTSSRVRVDIRRLDALMNLIGELVIARSRIESLAAETDSETLIEAVDRAGRLIGEMQQEVIESRMVPVWQVFDRFPRVVRDVARSVDKEVEVVITGKELELDRSMLDAIGDPLIHMLRNAVDHGIEPPDEREAAGKPRSGRIELSAQRERSRVVITLRDDGRGVDRETVIDRARELGLLERGAEPTDNELFRLMARPGFSTTHEVTTVSGRGVGLNVVDEMVRGFGGSVEFSTERGVGTAFRLELPLTVAIVRALIVDVAGHEYALPTTFVRESLEVPELEVESAHGREWINWREEILPMRRLRSLFGQNGNGSGPSRGDDGSTPVVVLQVGGERFAVAVDALIDEEEIVVKTFDPPRGSVQLWSGATVRPDGRPALILDAGRLR